MSVYVRLKKGEVQAPKYGKIIYPSEKYIPIDDKYLELVKNDKRLEVLEQEAMNAVIEDETKLIDDTVFGHWKQSEKRIASMTNKDLVQKIRDKARANGKDKIAEIAQDKFEELS